MKKLIILAAQTKQNLDWLYPSIDQQGFSYQFCFNIKDVFKKLENKGHQPTLIIIDSGLWNKITKNEAESIKNIASDIPFVLLDKNNITFNIEDWLTGSLHHLTILGQNLIEYLANQPIQT